MEFNFRGIQNASSIYIIYQTKDKDLFFIRLDREILTVKHSSNYFPFVTL